MTNYIQDYSSKWHLIAFENSDEPYLIAKKLKSNKRIQIYSLHSNFVDHFDVFGILDIHYF